jgi:REP element-mobilizing transposase RayT
MYHHVAKSLPGTLLFRTDVEAAQLWSRLVQAFPELLGLCLMPDHVHLLLPHDDPHRRLSRVASGYARWRGARRGKPPRAWLPIPPPTVISDRRHLERTQRYVVLNPCRKGIAPDPLAWAWSTHRDRCGLAAPAAQRAHPRPEEWHRYASGDPTVAPAGTALPARGHGPWTIEQVLAAVSAVCRAPLPDLRRRGSARTLVVGVAAAAGIASAPVIADALGVHRSAVYRQLAHSKGTPSPAERACLVVLGDPRFPLLDETDRISDPAWRPYRG